MLVELVCLCIPIISEGWGRGETSQ